MTVQLDPDILGDKDAQVILSVVDERLTKMADYAKGEAINWEGTMECREKMANLAKSAGMGKDWRKVVGETAVISACLKMLMNLDPITLHHIIVHTNFPLETAALITSAAMKRANG